MNNTIMYKGYIGSVEFSEEDCIFFGKVLGIRSLISYEGENAKELLDDFHGVLMTIWIFVYKTPPHQIFYPMWGCFLLSKSLYIPIIFILILSILPQYLHLYIYFCYLYFQGKMPLSNLSRHRLNFYYHMSSAKTDIL